MMIWKTPLKYFRDVSNIQEVEGSPSIVSTNINPVIDLNPKISTYANSGSTSTSAATITLLPAQADKDFYITSVYLSFYKNATSDTATSSISLAMTVNGKIFNIILLPITATGSEQHAYMGYTFPYPLKIDRNTSISCLNVTFTAGTNRAWTGMTGYFI